MTLGGVGICDLTPPSNMKKILAIYFLGAISLIAQPFTNFQFLTIGSPDAGNGDSLYIASLKINNNILQTSNTFRYFETNVVGFPAALTNLSNSLMANLQATNIALGLTIQDTSNSIVSQLYLGNSIYYYSPTNTIPFISNSLATYTVNASHYFRPGIYPYSSYYIPQSGIDGGTFSIRNATNFVVEGLGSVTFVNTNCYGITAFGSQTNQGGTVFNFLNFDGIRCENLSFIWTNTMHSKTSSSAGAVFNIQGTNNINADFIRIRTFQNPHHGIGSLSGSPTDNRKTNINVIDCYFAYSGQSNAPVLGADGTDILLYCNSKVIRSQFHNCIRPVELEGSVGLIAVPFYGNSEIAGCLFNSPVDQCISLQVPLFSGVIDIHDNYFVATNPLTTGGPFGVWGSAPKLRVHDNTFIGNFTAGVYYRPTSALTNEGYWIYNNSFVSNSIGVHLVDAGGLARSLNFQVKNNIFRRGIDGALWLRGIYDPVVEGNTFIDNYAVFGDIRVFGGLGSGQSEMTNCIIRNNVHENFTANTPQYCINIYTNLGFGFTNLPCSGQTVKVRGNTYQGNYTSMVLDGSVDVQTNLTAIPVVNQVRTNLFHDVIVSGSYRVDPVGAAVSVGFVQMYRSNNVWVPYEMGRVSKALTSLIEEIPFSYKVEARNLFYITNYTTGTGAVCGTNWNWRFDQ